MKALKIVASVCAAIVLLLGGVAGYLLATFDAERIKQEIAAAVGKQTGRVLKIEGDLSLAFWPNVGVRLGRTTLSEAGGSGEFARLASASVAVAVMPLLSKSVQVREVVIDGLAATVVKNKDGTLNIADLLGVPAGKDAQVGAGATAPGPTPTIDIAAIRITNARFEWRDAQAGSALTLADLDLSSGAVRFANGAGSVAALTLAARGKLDADAFTVNFEAPRLDIAPEGARGETLKLVATLDGQDRKIAATLALSGVTGDAAALRIEKFALEADAKLADAHAIVKLAAPVALDTAKQTVALDDFSGRLDLTHPDLPMKTLGLPLAGAASVNLAKQSATLRLDTKLDDSTIKAKLDIGKFAPLALVFDLDIDTLDLDRYLPKEKKESGDGRIDLAALKGLDLSGTARIGQLTVAKVKAGDIRVRIEAKNGRLDVAPLSANLYDGRIEGEKGGEKGASACDCRCRFGRALAGSGACLVGSPAERGSNQHRRSHGRRWRRHFRAGASTRRSFFYRQDTDILRIRDLVAPEHLGIPAALSIHRFVSR